MQAAAGVFYFLCVLTCASFRSSCPLAATPGAIAGIVIGCLLILLVLCIVAVVLCRPLCCSKRKPFGEPPVLPLEGGRVRPATDSRSDEKRGVSHLADEGFANDAAPGDVVLASARTAEGGDGASSPRPVVQLTANEEGAPADSVAVPVSPPMGKGGAVTMTPPSTLS